MSAYVLWHRHDFALLATDTRWTFFDRPHDLPPWARVPLADKMPPYTVEDYGEKLIPLDGGWATACGSSIVSDAVAPALTCLRAPRLQDLGTAVSEALRQGFPDMDMASCRTLWFAALRSAEHGYQVARVGADGSQVVRADRETLDDRLSDHWAAPSEMPDEDLVRLELEYRALDAARPDWPGAVRRIARMMAMVAAVSDRVSPAVDAGLVLSEGLVRVQAPCAELVNATDSEIRAKAIVPMVAAEAGADVTAGKSFSVLVDRTMDNVSDTASRVAVSPDQRTGAGRAFSALDSNNRLNDQTHIPMVGVGNRRGVQFVSGGGDLITASGSGGIFNIDVAAHTLRIGGTAVTYNADRAVVALAETVYYVYVDDPTFAGGAVSYLATTDKETAISGDGRYYVGAVTTPPSGGGTNSGTIGGGGEIHDPE